MTFANILLASMFGSGITFVTIAAIAYLLFKYDMKKHKEEIESRAKEAQESLAQQIEQATGENPLRNQEKQKKKGEVLSLIKDNDEDDDDGDKGS